MPVFWHRLTPKCLDPNQPLRSSEVQSRCQKKDLATENGTSEPKKKMPTSQKRWLDTKKRQFSMPKTRIQNLDATKKISIPQKRSKNLDAKKKTSRYQLKESPVFLGGGKGAWPFMKTRGFRCRSFKGQHD